MNLNDNPPRAEFGIGVFFGVAVSALLFVGGLLGGFIDLPGYGDETPKINELVMSEGITVEDKGFKIMVGSAVVSGYEGDEQRGAYSFDIPFFVPEAPEKTRAYMSCVLMAGDELLGGGGANLERMSGGTMRVHVTRRTPAKTQCQVVER